MADTVLGRETSLYTYGISGIGERERESERAREGERERGSESESESEREIDRIDKPEPYRMQASHRPILEDPVSPVQVP